jgi:hypothetical protein
MPPKGDPVIDRSCKSVYTEPVRRYHLSRFLPFLLALACVFLPGARAAADAQVSVRPFLEFGKRFVDKPGVNLDEGIIGLLGRADAMFGAPKPRSFRIGPVLEARTVDFASMELGAGAGILIPFPGDCPIGVSGLITGATRKDVTDTLNAAGILTWGFRGYNYHHWYGYALNAFGSVRKNITGNYDVLEVSGGVEIDIQFVTVIPFMFIKNLIGAEDPHKD